MFSTIFNEIKKNLKNPTLYIVFLILLVSVFLLFPYIDANYFYYKRIEKRVNILERITGLNTTEIQRNPTLDNEYNSILQEIAQQPENSVNNMFVKDNRRSVIVAKFISGGILIWTMALACIFMKSFRDVKTRVIGVVLLSIVGLIIGAIAKSIPNVFNPWVNYIGYPILEIILLALLVTLSNSKRNLENKCNNHSMIRECDDRK